MEQNLLIAIIAGLCGMLGWGLADFFAKKTIDEIGDIVSLVWAHVFGTAGFLLVALYQQFVLNIPLTVPSDLTTWAGLAFFGSLQAIVYFLAYKGFGKGKIAILNPIFASYSGLAAVISIVVFGELLTPSLVIALIALVTGIMLLNTDINAFEDKRLKIMKTPGLKEVLSAALCAAFWTVFWDQFIGGQDWVSYALFMYIFMTVAAFLISRYQKVKLSGVKPAMWKFLMLIGICEVVAYLGISLGFSMTSYTSVVALLSGAFSLPTMFLAYVFLKERVTKLQTIGGLVIVAGLIVLALY